LLDLLACEFASAGELTQHPLAVGAGLIDHLATLLLGHRQFGLGVGGGVRTSARCLDLCFLSHAGGLVAGLAQQLRGALLGFLADLGGALARRRQHPRGLLAEQPRERLLVELHRGQVGVRLGDSEFTFEEPFALLQTPEFGCDHAQEVADLCLVEAATAGAECSVGNRRR
jgi:hypothetical protein